jgi:hypothetical protein
MMAATKRTLKLGIDDRTREKIRTSQLINRLHDHVFGEAEMSQTQMKAVEILLRKTMPDLAAIEHSGETKVTYDIASEPISPERWAEQHATTH